MTFRVTTVERAPLFSILAFIWTSIKITINEIKNATMSQTISKPGRGLKTKTSPPFA
jgi:hypothetical protein